MSHMLCVHSLLYRGSVWICIFNLFFSVYRKHTINYKCRDISIFETAVYLCFIWKRPCDTRVVLSMAEFQNVKPGEAGQRDKQSMIIIDTIPSLVRTAKQSEGDVAFMVTWIPWLIALFTNSTLSHYFVHLLLINVTCLW